MRRYKVCEDFGKRVQSRRSKLKMSQEDLAELTKLHRNHIGRIERGETNPPLYTVYRIARALKTSSENLLTF